MNEILVSAGNLSVSYYKKNYLSDQMWGESEQSFFHSFCLHAVSWVCCSPWWKLVMHVPWGNKFLRVLIIAIFVGFFFVICKLLQNKLTPLAKLYSHTNITSTGTVDSCLPFKTSLSYRNKTMKWETKHSKFYRKGLSEETPLKTIFYSWNFTPLFELSTAWSWDAISLHWISWYPFIHLGGERHCEGKVPCSRTQHNVPGQGSNLQISTLTMSSLCLPKTSRLHLKALCNWLRHSSSFLPAD